MGNILSVNELFVDEENIHNHPCTLHYNRITTKEKQKLTPSSDIDTITKMIQNKTRIDKMARKKKHPCVQLDQVHLDFKKKKIMILSTL